MYTNKQRQLHKLSLDMNKEGYAIMQSVKGFAVFIKEGNEVYYGYNLGISNWELVPKDLVMKILNKYLDR